MENTIKKPKKKISKKVKIIAIILSAVILIAVGLTIYTYWVLGKVKHVDIDKSPDALGISDEYTNDENSGKYSDIVNIALFGVDARGNQPSRSDAIMILSVNRKKNEVKVISIMRDSYVTIEGHGKTKLNEAYFYGGAPLAIKTLNQDYNLNIKDYVTVNFDSMAKVIDAVGGVTINISEAERQNANHNIQEYAGIWNVKPTYIDHSGEQVLDGMQAVGYARIRYVGNCDYERTERQRTVMEQLFNKALKMSPLEYPNLLSTILPLVETSLKSEDILGIGTSVMKSGSAKFEQERFPIDKDIEPNDMIDGVSYVISDLNVTSAKLHDYIFDDVDPSTNTYKAPSSSQSPNTTKAQSTGNTQSTIDTKNTDNADNTETTSNTHSTNTSQTTATRSTSSTQSTSSTHSTTTTQTTESTHSTSSTPTTESAQSTGNT